MSKCQNCLQGMCRKHPLLDHGARAAALQAKVNETSKQQLNDLIQLKIKQAEEEARKSTEQDEQEVYRLEMDKIRNQAEKDSKKRKLNVDSGKFAGLNPSVARLMAGHSDDESSGSRDNNNESGSDSNSSSDDDDNASERKSSKKSKKTKKEKKDKKDKKSKKSKKDKRKKDRK